MILEMPTNSERQEALEILPTGLYNSFRGIITRIRRRPKASAELGMRVLMWLHFAYRPLKLVELQHALATRNSHTEFDAGSIPSQKALLDSCLGLVLVDEETLTVRFTHFTLEEYFRDNASTEFPNGYSSIAKTCLTYLCFGELRQHCMDLDSLKENSSQYAFLNYAALYWGTYYVKQQCVDDLKNLARVILEHEDERPPCAIQALYFAIDRRWDFAKTIAQKFSGIHATAYFGLSEHVVHFHNVELLDEGCRTPLSWAAQNGHEAVVRLLVERNGIDINSRDSYYRKTPLMWAAENGHESIVQLLIESDGVDINCQDTYDEKTALMWAAEDGHEAVVRLLIERDGIDISAKNCHGKPAFILAAQRGHEAVVRLLMKTGGIDISAKDEYGKTALILAAMTGHEAVVRLLIERRDINAEDNEESTALRYAAQYGHEEVVRLLVEKSSADDIDSRVSGQETALSFAAVFGHEAIVRLMIERGVDINCRDAECGETPLMWAAAYGRETVVRVLTERGDIDIDARNPEGETALSLAVAGGHNAVVQLLNNRRDMQARDSDTAPADSLAEVPCADAEAACGVMVT